MFFKYFSRQILFSKIFKTILYIQVLFKPVQILAPVTSWLVEISCKIVDNSYQLSDPTAYQLNQVSGLNSIFYVFHIDFRR